MSQYALKRITEKDFLLRRNGLQRRQLPQVVCATREVTSPRLNRIGDSCFLQAFPLVIQSMADKRPWHPAHRKSNVFPYLSYDILLSLVLKGVKKNESLNLSKLMPTDIHNALCSLSKASSEFCLDTTLP